MLPTSKNLDLLFKPLKIAGKTLTNRIVFHPMEGCDGERDGSPSELTARRYRNFAGSFDTSDGESFLRSFCGFQGVFDAVYQIEGTRGENNTESRKKNHKAPPAPRSQHCLCGSALIWFEAVAIVPEGRANPRQLWLTNNNLPAFSKLVENVKAVCQKNCGFEPVVIMQATHSGRYSRPDKRPAPLSAYDLPGHTLQNENIVTDGYLKQLEAEYGNATRQAAAAGFDGIDIKCCHGYLASELLSAYNRAGEYGGSFENRTRFITNAVAAAKACAPAGFIVTSRINLYDGFEYPHGFGTAPNCGLEPDFSEGIALCKKLDLPLVNVTCGNPYVNPEVNRPVKSLRDYKNRVLLLLNAAKAVTQNVKTEVVCSGISGLETDAPNVAAGAIEQGFCSLAGFGRLTFAYPDFVKDIKTGLNPKKVCITCAKCTELMRAGAVTGCVIRDKYYSNLYKEIVKK